MAYVNATNTSNAIAMVLDKDSEPNQTNDPSDRAKIEKGKGVFNWRVEEAPIILSGELSAPVESPPFTINTHILLRFPQGFHPLEISGQAKIQSVIQEL